MAIAGRRYANVPVIVRGSLQDAPVLTTRPPVVVARPPDRRWFAGRPPLVLSSPLAQAVAPAVATPAPLVVASPRPWPRTVQALTVRSTLQDPPVLTTPRPVITAAQPDRRWYTSRVTVITGRGAPAPPASTGLLMVMGF